MARVVIFIKICLQSARQAVPEQQYGFAMDEKEAAKAIAQAVDMGYIYFDTAECYTGNRPKVGRRKLKASVDRLY